jgi:hypothetical protein
VASKTEIKKCRFFAEFIYNAFALSEDSEDAKSGIE